MNAFPTLASFRNGSKILKINLPAEIVDKQLKI